MESILLGHILCFSETWELEKPSTPKYLDEYNMVHSVAVRDKQRGRGSGGLITLIKKCIEFEVVSISNLWIFIKIRFSQNMTIIIGNVYFKPTYQLEQALESLDLLLKELDTNNVPIVIGGDFNSRTADANYLDENLAEEYGLLAQRISVDEVLNKRGEQLLSCMEDHGFLLLNGRTNGDVPGQFTYISRVGSSTVDLVWTNLESSLLVSELHVSDTVIVSDHLPIALTLNIPSDVQQNNSSQSKVTKFKWLPDRIEEFSDYVNRVHISSQVVDVYTELVKTIQDAAAHSGMIQEFSLPTKFNINKPWYNKQCRDLKKMSRKTYRKWRQHRKQEHLELFLKLKKDYNQTCLHLKNEHEQKIKEKLSTVRNPQEFWEAVKKFKPRSQNKSKIIPIEEWSQYLGEMYRCSVQDSEGLLNLTFHDVLREQMDSTFCIGELERAITHMKRNKSPGPDNVLNEYLKVLGENWKTHLLQFINYIFDGGDIPEAMCQSYMCMLHKKGDPTVCNNYRNIALLNNILKLITHLAAQRIMVWSEDSGILSEAQTGFRPNRGCVDNIFSLHSIISLQIVNQRKLYAAFVDYKSAFPGVQHDLLFAKMFTFGVSGKMVSLLRRIYERATTQIKVENKRTAKQKITKGVLQGDSCSTVAFIIFINDLEDYFREKGAEGVPINNSKDILLLLYCDDLIVLSNSKVDMQRKLNILARYCEENKMVVNEAKSKIVVFRRGGKLAQTDEFHYKNRTLEVKNEYVYLGIKFSSHAVFHKAALQAVSRGKMSVSSVKNVLINSKMTSQESRMKLYRSIVCATLLYGAEVWGSRYEDVIEPAQSQFIKSVFCLPRSTPHYLLRLEFGIVKLAHLVLKQMLRWWLKLLSMSEERFPKICFNQLVQTDQLARNIEKYNWASLLRVKLVGLGFGEVWEAQSCELLKNKMDEILSSYECQLIEQDYDRLEHSSYCTWYKELKPKPEEMESITSSYVSIPGPICRTRVIAQIRLSGNSKVNFYINRISYCWNSEEECTLCNLQENENMYHFFFKCPHFECLRNQYLRKWLDDGQLTVKSLVENPSRSDINNVFFFVQGALRLRAFLRNE